MIIFVISAFNERLRRMLSEDKAMLYLALLESVAEVAVLLVWAFFGNV